MQRTRIKFCGITRAQDAIAAAAAGADAVGLVFYEKSSRCVTIDNAREILKSLPPFVQPVALFVNASPDEVRATTKALNIRTIQLHGDEPPEQLPEFADFNVIKAVHCDAAKLASTLNIWRDAAAQHKNLAGLLLETASPSPGGTGIENNWVAIESALQSRASLPPVIAAGGLTPENVDAVVRRLKPFAVDVSSGIEERPGNKSVDKMNRFAQQVRDADILV